MNATSSTPAHANPGGVNNPTTGNMSTAQIVAKPTKARAALTYLVDIGLTPYFS